MTNELITICPRGIIGVLITGGLDETKKIRLFSLLVNVKNKVISLKINSYLLEKTKCNIYPDFRVIFTCNESNIHMV